MILLLLNELILKRGFFFQYILDNNIWATYQTVKITVTKVSFERLLNKSLS